MCEREREWLDKQVHGRTLKKTTTDWNPTIKHVKTNWIDQNEYGIISTNWVRHTWTKKHDARQPTFNEEHSTTDENKTSKINQRFMIHMCILWFSISCSVPQRQYSVCFWPFLQFSSGAYCHFWLCCVLSACVLIMQDSFRILYSVVFLFWLLCVSKFWVFRVLCGCFEINLCTFLVERPFTQSLPLILLMSCSVLCYPAFVALPLSYPLFFFCCYCQSLLWKNSFAMLQPPKKKKNMAEPQPV